jgi:hypothetical protein
MPNNELLYEQWYHIPGFNGYVINNCGDVKSFKFFKSSPNGIILSRKTDKEGSDYYVLTNDKNIRQKISVDKLLQLMRNTKDLYTQPEGSSYVASRNRGFMNYAKKYPTDNGTPDSIYTNSILENRKKNDYDPNDVKLDFSFMQKKKESIPMVKFY